MPAKVSVPVPDSLSSLLQRFRSCFTAPGYEVFTAMFTGFILRPVERTVCGMLTGAGLAGIWHHSRAHRFFSGTRWDVQQVGLILAALDVDLLLPPGRGDPARHRRNPDPTTWTESLRRVLVARRLRRRHDEDRLRQLCRPDGYADPAGGSPGG